MTCTVNGQIIPCEIFWSQYGWIFAIIFTVFGLLLLVKVNWLVNLQIWWLKKVFNSEFKPGKQFLVFWRIIGALFLLIGLFSFGKIFSLW